MPEWLATPVFDHPTLFNKKDSLCGPYVTWITRLPWYASHSLCIDIHIPAVVIAIWSFVLRALGRFVAILGLGDLVKQQIMGREYFAQLTTTTIYFQILLFGLLRQRLAYATVHDCPLLPNWDSSAPILVSLTGF